MYYTGELEGHVIIAATVGGQIHVYGIFPERLCLSFCFGSQHSVAV